MAWTGGGDVGEVISKGSYAYTWPEVQAMLRAAWNLSDRHFALLHTLAYTGRRPGEVVGNQDTKARHVKAYWVTPEGKIDPSKFEIRPMPIMGLTPGDIDFDRRVITFTIEKKFKRRNVPGEFQTVTRVTKVKEVSPRVLGVLGAYIGRHSIGQLDRVFPFTIQWAWQLVKDAYILSGIKGKQHLAKAFRHGFALRCLETGETASDITDLQDALEHNDVRITMGYTRFRKRHVRALLDRMDSVEPIEGPPLVPSETEQNKPV